MFPQSIRWRIQLWHGALLICLVALMMGTFFIYIRAERFRALDEELDAFVTPLMPRILPRMDGNGFGPHGPPPEGEGQPPDDRM